MEPAKEEARVRLNSWIKKSAFQTIRWFWNILLPLQLPKTTFLYFINASKINHKFQVRFVSSNLKI
jgi:hypothetical protein